MSMHVPKDHFETGATFHGETAPAMVHPLANPHVVRVIPFWTDGIASRGDITDGAYLFEADFRASKEAIYQITSGDISSAHGMDVANQLEGRTGLYIVVDDLASLRGNIAGVSISDGITEAGIAELVMESPVGLLIFAECKTATESVRLAA